VCVAEVADAEVAETMGVGELRPGQGQGGWRPWLPPWLGAPQGGRPVSQLHARAAAPLLAPTSLVCILVPPPPSRHSHRLRCPPRRPATGQREALRYLLSEYLLRSGGARAQRGLGQVVCLALSMPPRAPAPSSPSVPSLLSSLPPVQMCAYVCVCVRMGVCVRERECECTRGKKRMICVMVLACLVRVSASAARCVANVLLMCC